MAHSNAGLPRQVVEQADLAEQFMATLSGKKEDTDENEEETPEVEDDAEGGTAEEEEEELETAPSEEEEHEDDDEDATYQQRYRSLKGKYDKEVPRLNQELKELKDRVFETLGQLGQQKQTQPTVEESVDTDDGFAEELESYREQFGDDLLAFIDKITDRKTKALLKESLAPVTQKVDSVESTQMQTAQSVFINELNTKVEGDWGPLWEGKDPEFKAFLETKEPNGFFTYKELAKRANEAWDSDMFAAVFNAYLETQNKAQDPPARKKTAKEDSREAARVQPKRNAVASEPDGTEPKIWTQAEIRQFQEDDRRGKIAKDVSEALWADLLSAPSQNRIVK